jgi:3-phosphoshikimate 1-carboxyvinyltransferase
VVAAPQRYQSTAFTIEPDASSASYFLSAPAVTGGRVTVEGLGAASIQGDVEFVQVLGRMGCQVTREARRLAVSRPPREGRLRAVDVNLGAMPDMVPTLAVLALFADGVTVIRGVPNLRLKETDRLAALSAELAKLGASVEQTGDGLRIAPPRYVRPATIETYQDHRMAMSFALAGLVVPGIEIVDPECCAKTFPDFLERWRQLRMHPA